MVNFNPLEQETNTTNKTDREADNDYLRELQLNKFYSAGVLSSNHVYLTFGNTMFCTSQRKIREPGHEMRTNNKLNPQDCKH